MKNAIKNTVVENSRQRYKTPEANVIFVNAQSVLCQSGNEAMREYDFGDAGFGEVLNSTREKI